MGNKVGLYAWAGPGTIRLLKTKYHNQKINEKSFLSLYELGYLKKAQEMFGVTDTWVTYSWGFTDKTEEEDYEFITSRLKNFKSLGINTNAYVQGFNLVTNEFRNENVFCRDYIGRLLPYSKGRSLTCPNNPQFESIFLDRVGKAAREDFAGVFVDNILFGLPPLYVREDYLSSFGCSCLYCKEKFKKTYGYTFPAKHKGRESLSDFLEFRDNSTFEILKKAKEICERKRKRFGVNLYDPIQYNPELFFGYNFKQISTLLDYNLIENLSLPSQKDVNNSYLKSFIASSNKPTFIVSYKKGIGLDGEYSQNDIDSIFNESERLNYNPCLKVSEFYTRGVWHALDLSGFSKPAKKSGVFKPIQIKSEKIKKSTKLGRIASKGIDRIYPKIVSSIYERKLLSRIFQHPLVYSKLVKQFRSYDLDKFVPPKGQKSKLTD